MADGGWRMGPKSSPPRTRRTPREMRTRAYLLLLPLIVALLIGSTSTSTFAAFFDCSGFGPGFGIRPTMTDKRSSNMEPVDICVYGEKPGPALHLKVPAAYLEKEIRHKNGQVGVIWLVFWLPDYRPTSEI